MKGKPGPRKPDTTTETQNTGSTERLQKLLARAGVASRRAAEEMIAAGKVRVNGVVVTEMGTRANPATDKIEVDGRPLKVSPITNSPEQFAYILLKQARRHSHHSSRHARPSHSPRHNLRQAARRQPAGPEHPRSGSTHPPANIARPVTSSAPQPASRSKRAARYSQGLPCWPSRH